MIFAAELAGSFLAGAVTACGGVWYFGRRIIRKKLGGMVDLLGITPK